VTRRFEREMGDALFGQRGEKAVQLNRIGVVCLRLLVPDGLTTPTVPRLAAANPCAAQSWRTNDATDVLPLVPVTATAISG